MLRNLAMFVILAAASLAAADAPSRTGTLQLQAGEYLWMPELSPSGPVVAVISLPEQLIYVYRNGIRIGVSTVSTGKKGYETPTGVFTILEKHREHFSNRYDNAPMPYMQRLTWDGVALHAGNVPGYPASHGCVRLPYAFSELLYGTTTRGMTVVVTDQPAQAPEVAAPGVFATGTGPTAGLAGPAPAAGAWHPERAPSGPLSILLSLSDHRMVVLRNGIEIGRAGFRFVGPPPAGTQVYVLLEGTGPGPSPVVPGRPALRWMQLPLPGQALQGDTLRAAVASGRMRLPGGFAAAVYDALTPGSTVVSTDEPIHAMTPELTVLRADQGQGLQDGPPDDR